MSLVINSLRGRHAHKNTHIHTQAYRHLQTEQPGLKIALLEKLLILSSFTFLTRMHGSFKIFQGKSSLPDPGGPDLSMIVLNVLKGDTNIVGL